MIEPCRPARPRSTRFLVLVALLALPLIPAGSSQGTADLRLWPSPQRAAVNDQDTNCLNEAFTYPLGPSVPAAGSAVLGGSAGATPCSTQFVFNVTTPIVVEGTVRVHVVLKCDPGSLAAGPTDGVPTVRLVLLHNDKSLLNNATVVPADTCANGAAKTYEAQATVANRTVLYVRDQLVLRVVSAWVNPPSATGKGLAVVTGGSGSYVDLPGPAPAAPSSSSAAPASPSPSASTSQGRATSSAAETGPGENGTDGGGRPLTPSSPKGGAPGVPALLVAATVMAVAASLRRRKPSE